MPASEGAWRAEIAGIDARRRPVMGGVFASVMLALGLAVFLLVRRAMGALTAPLPPALLLLTAAAVLGWVWCARVAWRRCGGQETIFSRPVDHFVAEWMPSVALCLVAVACSYPGGRVVDWVVWLPVLIASAAGEQLLERWRRRQTVAGSPLPTHAARRGPNSLESSPAESSVPIDESGTLLQQLTRSRTAEGCETISGTLTAEFGKGERTTTVHIAFCPPFESLPQVEAEIVDGPDASVQVTQILHNGARLDVRLAEVMREAVSVTLEFVAQESAE